MRVFSQNLPTTEITAIFSNFPRFHFFFFVRSHFVQQSQIFTNLLEKLRSISISKFAPRFRITRSAFQPRISPPVGNRFLNRESLKIYPRPKDATRRNERSILARRLPFLSDFYRYLHGERSSSRDSTRHKKFHKPFSAVYRSKNKSETKFLHVKFRISRLQI